MNPLKTLRNLIVECAIQQLSSPQPAIDQVRVEFPKKQSHGELSSNVALVLFKYSNYKTAQDLALALRDKLSTNEIFSSVEVASPGFLNFVLKDHVWQAIIPEVLQQGQNYGRLDIGRDRSVNVEYVSANPTGPMHVGHLRAAIVGDVLARLLDFCGYNVTKEFYINDAGNQVNKLADSVYARYIALVNKQEAIIPAGLYPGSYLIPVAEGLHALHGPALSTMPLEQSLPIVKDFAVKEMMKLIKADLKLLDIEHQVFFSEQSLHSSGKVQELVNQLMETGLIYKGTLPPPKHASSEEWEPGEQLLLKCTAYGDDQDRTIMRSDNTFTYAAGELAYTASKVSRGYDHMVVVLGADHIGYVKRLQAIFKSVSAKGQVVLSGLVNYLEDGQVTKMSKRAGTITTIKDVLDRLDKDIIRFMMLIRRNDSILDFDLKLAKEYSKDNPAFYVQYAHVRATSIVKNASEKFTELSTENSNLELLNSVAEKHILKLLAIWPQVVEDAAREFEPHKIAFYLQEISGAFHNLWTEGGQRYRFIVEDNQSLTEARFALALTVKTVIGNGLNLIGVTPLLSM